MWGYSNIILCVVIRYRYTNDLDDIVYSLVVVMVWEEIYTLLQTITSFSCILFASIVFPKLKNFRIPSQFALE